MNEELTQSQQAALETQQRYQELFEEVPEAYLVTDLQGLIEEANCAAAQLFHLGRAQLAGLPWRFSSRGRYAPPFGLSLPGYGMAPRCVSGSSVYSRDTNHPCRWSVMWRHRGMSMGSSSACGGCYAI